MSGRDVHRGGTMLFSFAMVVIGVALLVEAVAADSVFSLLALAGVCFLGAGAGRLYVEARRGRT